MAEYWWRSWHGAPMDHKWAVIAAKSGAKTGIVSAIAWALFDYASQQLDRGSIKGFDVETYAVYSGFSEDEISAVMSAMKDKGVIDENDRLTAWDKRQPKSETEILRSRRNRLLNEADTNQSSLLQNATEKYIDTDTESDTDTDKDKESSDPFEPVQHSLEKITGLPALPRDVDAINEIAKIGALYEDMKAGYDWFVSQPGNKLRSFRSLIGPIRTAMGRRTGAIRPAGVEPTVKHVSNCMVVG